MKVKEKWKKYEELWSKIRDLISSVTKNSDDYNEKYKKIKFKLDDELPLTKTIEIHNMITVVRAAIQENNRNYPQVFLNGCLYELWILCKCYINLFFFISMRENLLQPWLCLAF